MQIGMTYCWLVSVPRVSRAGCSTPWFDSLQVFEGGDSDNEVSGGFASLGGQKGSTKPWPRLVNLGSDEQSTAPSLSLENGGSLNTSSTLGHGQSPWGDRRSPPLSNTQSGGHDPNSKVKPRPSTSSTKRTSLWGLSSVCCLTTHFAPFCSCGCYTNATDKLEVLSVLSRKSFQEHPSEVGILLRRDSSALFNHDPAIEA
jgi:hypothetical protein